MSSSDSDRPRRKKARFRALRAARAVTIAAALAGAPACALSHSPGDPPPPPDDASVRADGSRPRDAGTDAPPIADAGRDAFAECPMPAWDCTCEPMTEACCTLYGWWDDTSECCQTCVEGPMVPPSMPA